MTVELRVGNTTFRVAASGTRAPDRVSFPISEAVCAAAATQKPVSVSLDPFEAVRHEHRISNCPSVVKEDDSPITSASAHSARVPQYHGTHGRLLAFKNKR